MVKLTFSITNSVVSFSSRLPFGAAVVPGGNAALASKRDRVVCRLSSVSSALLVCPATQFEPLSSPCASDCRKTAAAMLFLPLLESSQVSGSSANSG